jgi:hypothetical protein
VPKSQRQLPRATVAPVELKKPQRKPVRLTRAQAYSILHSTPGSAFHKELSQDYKLYMSANPTTVEKYKDLFSTERGPNLPFVTFQQTVLRDRVCMISEEEQASIDEFIDKRFQKVTDDHENPWRALRVDDAQTDVDLERQYVKRYFHILILH